MKDFLLGKSRCSEHLAEHLATCRNCFVAIESLPADDELTLALIHHSSGPTAFAAAPELVEAIEIATELVVKRS